jgi:hypothetical protein
MVISISGAGALAKATISLIYKTNKAMVADQCAGAHPPNGSFF